MYFHLGGVSVLLAGIISALFISGVISKVVQYILFVVLIGGALVLVYLNYDVIESRIQYIQKKDEIASQVVQRLKDIRTAEIAYQKSTGVYTSSFDTLISYLKDGKMPIVKQIGSLPDSVPTLEAARKKGILYSKLPDGMTEEDAMKKGLIIRDTIYVSVLQNTFLTKEALSKRKYPFYVDSIPYVPYSGLKFNLQAGKLDVGGIQKPVFMAEDPKPFAGTPLSVGSMNQVSTSGNWKE